MKHNATLLHGLCLTMVIVLPGTAQTVPDLDGDLRVGAAELRSFAKNGIQSRALFQFTTQWGQWATPANGYTIVYIQNISNVNTVVVANTQTGITTPLTNLFTVTMNPGYPSLSPDGKSLFFMDRNFQPHSLYRSDVSGNNPIQLYPDNSLTVAPPRITVSANHSIVYSQLSNTQISRAGLWFDRLSPDGMRLSSFHLVPFRINRPNPGNPSITADGTWLYYFNYNSQTLIGNIERIKTDGTQNEVIVSGITIVYPHNTISVSGDGSLLVYNQDYEIIVLDTRSKKIKSRITHGLALNEIFRSPDISTDGETIVFVRGVFSLFSPGRLYIINTNGTGERKLADNALQPCIQ